MSTFDDDLRALREVFRYRAELAAEAGPNEIPAVLAAFLDLPPTRAYLLGDLPTASVGIGEWHFASRAGIADQMAEGVGIADAAHVLGLLVLALDGGGDALCLDGNTGRFVVASHSWMVDAGTAREDAAAGGVVGVSGPLVEFLLGHPAHRPTAAADGEPHERWAEVRAAVRERDGAELVGFGDGLLPDWLAPFADDACLGGYLSVGVPEENVWIGSVNVHGKVVPRNLIEALPATRSLALGGLFPLASVRGPTKLLVDRDCTVFVGDVLELEKRAQTSLDAATLARTSFARMTDRCPDFLVRLLAGELEDEIRGATKRG